MTQTPFEERIVRLTDPKDPRVADYTSLTDVALRRKIEPERGLYLAESAKVLRRALDASMNSARWPISSTCPN